MFQRHTTVLLAMALGVWAAGIGSAAAATNGEKCAAAKMKVASKYAACRFSADSKAISKGEPVDYSRCDTTQSTSWQKIEDKYGVECLTSGDQAGVQSNLTSATNCMSGVLAGNGGSCSFTANPPCVSGGQIAFGKCWIVGASGDSCNAACGLAGMQYDTATATVAGLTSNIARCLHIADLFGYPHAGTFGGGGPPDTGCAISGVTVYLSSSGTPQGQYSGFRRVCACN